MKSWKEYKLLRENFGAPISLGMSTTPSILFADLGQKAEEVVSDNDIDSIQTLEEAKQKLRNMKKKMLGDVQPVEPTNKDEDEDEVDVDADADAEDTDTDEVDTEKSKFKSSEKKCKCDCANKDKKEDETGDGEMVEPTSDKDVPPMMMKKNCSKKMKKENSEFWSSLNNQLNPRIKRDDGCSQWFKEDSLLPPSDPNVSLVDPSQNIVGKAPEAPIG